MSQRLFITLTIICLLCGSMLSAQNLENLVDSLDLQSDTLSIANDTLNLPVSSDGLDQEVNYSAEDSIIYDITNELVYLYGNAVVSTEQVTLEAGQIVFNFGDKSVDAQPLLDSLGNPIGVPMFREGTQEFSSDKISYNFDTKKGKISQLVTRQGEGYLVGGAVKKNEKDELFATDAYYTTCDLDHPHFKIRANKIKVIPDKVIVTGPANLEIADIPTPLFIPFAIMPLQKGRRSGVIMPKYGQSPGQGYYFREGGIYLGLNDYMDMAVLGDIYSRGTWKANLASNYKLRYRFSGLFSLEYGKLRTNDPLAENFQISKQFKVRWSHRQDPKAHPSRIFSAYVNAGTNRFDRTFLTNTNNLLNNTFGSNVTYSKTFARAPLRLSASASHSQNTNTRRVSITLPDVTLNLTKKIYPFKRKVQVGSRKWYENITLGYSSKFRNKVDAADSTFFRTIDEFGVGKFSTHSLDSLDYGAIHNIPISFNSKILKYVTFSSSLNLNHRWYNNFVEKSWNPQTVTDTIVNEEGVEEYEVRNVARVRSERRNGFRAPTDWSLSAGLNTRIFGMFNFGEGRRIKAIRHVMTPTASFNYRPDFANFWGRYYDEVRDSFEDSDLLLYSIFQDNIYGGPPVGESQSISLSLDNNFEMKVRAKEGSKEEYRKIKILEGLRFSMFHNFAAEEFKWSRLNVSARSTFFKKFGMNFNSTYDPYALDTITGKRVERFARNENQGLMRLENMNFSLNGRLDSRSLQPKDEKSSDKGTEEEREDLFQNPDDFVDYDIPWGFNFGYNLSFRKNYFFEGEVLTDSLAIVQTLNFGGDVSITPNWKVNISSGWDFVNNSLAFTRLNIFRDLHCWDMQFTWVPIGDFQMYEFQISVRSSLLQDLRLQRRRQWFDF